MRIMYQFEGQCWDKSGNGLPYLGQDFNKSGSLIREACLEKT